MVDVRDRRHVQTRSALLAATLDIAETEGYGAVTMERVAQRAGVSRRTLYRRFKSKDDIVLELPRRWLGVWDVAVADTRASGERRAAAVCESASLAVSASIDERPRDALVGLQILAEAPSLAGAGVASRSWLDRVAALLEADPEGVRWSDEERSYVAGAFLGGIEAMLAHWSGDEAAGSLVAANRVLLDRLRPIWPT